MYSIIDIETTGGKFNEEHIMEIAVYVFDGKTVVDQFITLVNPDAPIQQYVSKITGITQNMVLRSPKFYEIAKRIVKMTEDTVFVAHNVKFDYRVVQLEFERLGFEYHRKTLDTIDLCKELIPGLKTYGLESVCDALGISNTHRHRADGDARATVELFKILLEKDTNKLITKLSSSVEASENQHPFRDLVRPLKNVTGVYYLHNAQGKVIYIGKSADMQNSINRHFLATNQQALKLQAEAASINIEETGNEAIALIKAFAELRRVKPKFNTGIITKFLHFGLFAEKEGTNATFLRINQVRQKAPEVYFKEKDEAYQFLLERLVESKTDAETILASKDFDYLKDFLKRYTYKPERKDLPMAKLKQAVLPAAKFLALGAGRHPNEKSAILVENYSVKGYFYYELNSVLENEAQFKKLLTPVSSHAYINGLVRHFIEFGTLRVKEL